MPTIRTDQIEPVYAAVRRKCVPPLWAQGGKLASEGCVFLLRHADDEVAFTVRVPGWATPPTVVLYPETVEWGCDCGGSADPCPHVAAAVLAAMSAAREGREVPAAAVARARVVWRLAVDGAALRVSREVVGPDGTSVAPGGRLADARGVPEGWSLELTDADLALDRKLDDAGRGVVAGTEEQVVEWCAALARCAELTLDGAPVRVSEEPLRPLALVLDRDERDFALRIEKPAALARVLVAGVALVADSDGRNALRPLGGRALADARWSNLPAERRFAHADAASLLEALARAGEHAAVEVRTGRLPRTARGLSPRVAMELVHERHSLLARPTIVYGDPPQLRVEAGGASAVYLRGDVPVRDRAAEVALAHRVRDELNLVVGQPARFEGRAAAEFAHKLASWGINDRERVAIFGREPLVPRVELEGTRFDVAFELPPDPAAPEGTPARRADAQAVVRAWQEGLGLVALEGGGWAPLPSDWMARFGTRVADLLAARRADDHTVPTCALPDLARLCDELEHPRPPEVARFEALARDFEALPPAELPSDLRAELRTYQRRGVDWLAFLRDAGLGAVLADDMGLGKTLQTLCALRGRALVVCPRSVVHNWAAEIERFRPGLSHAIYHGAGRALDPRASVTLTTYAVARLDIEQLAAVEWDCVVLDEAQAIKNPDSQAARAAYRLNAGFRVALSGTPVENRLEELWSLLHFTNPGLLGGRSDFVERYAEPIAAGDAGAAARLRARIKPFVLRRMKREVAPELPPRTDVVLYCELDEAERGVYDAVRAATQREVAALFGAGEGDDDGGGGKGALAALEALLRLRQAACHPALVPGQPRAALGQGTSAKVERLVDSLEDAAADGHKALVFSQWTSLLDKVEGPLRDAGIAFTRLDGTTRDRAAVVADFQREDGPPVMLVSLKAGGTGLNLTAADHVFLLDPWWNPAVEDQAADRAHRIGQARAVTVYRLVARDTVDERILALQSRKRALADAALGEIDAGAALTRDDLRALLA